MMTYIQAIGAGWPAVQCHAEGPGDVYESIVWDGGDPLPTKAQLDAYIAGATAQGAVPGEITRYQFRKLFTLQERVAIDNAPSNPDIPQQYRALLITFLKDLELSGSVFLRTNPDIRTGLELLVACGLLGAGRVEQILSNTPPPEGAVTP